MTSPSQTRFHRADLAWLGLACIGLGLGLGSACAKLPQSASHQADLRFQLTGCFYSADQPLPVPVTLAVSSSRADRQQGLQNVSSLPDNHGMLFRYPEDQSRDFSFWMYQTLLPLDIAFISRDGRLEGINSMLPCLSADPGNCPGYPAGVPFRQAIEMKAGFYDENGIRVGDTFSPGPCREPTD